MYPVCGLLARSLQDWRTVTALEHRFQRCLVGSRLRVEYAQDVDGYWLEPHTDTIDPKWLTFMIALPSTSNGSVLGTELYDPDGNLMAIQPQCANSALVFAPDEHTWHGFAAKPIHGVRRSPIINYVGDAWPQEMDLSYPDESVGNHAFAP